MSTFKEIYGKIADGIKDISSLEVVTYKGTITIQSDSAIPTDFNKIIDNAKAEAGLKISACTLSELDGDMKVFYDNDITNAEMEAHHNLVDSARQNRQAIVDLFKDAILKEVG